MKIEIKGHAYVIGKLSAMKQFHVMRRLAGLLAAMAGAAQAGFAKGGAPKEKGKESAASPPPSPQVANMMALLDGSLDSILEPLADALAKMDDASAEFVIFSCLGVVERQQTGGGFSKVAVNGQLMFEDIDMATMLTLVAKVLQENLAGFFGDLTLGFPGAAQT